MIRVLHYVGKMNRGGMETFIMNLYRNIDKKEIQFDFAVHSSKNGDYEDEIISYGGKFFQFPTMRSNPLAYRRAWRKFFKEHKNEYEVFHFHTNSLANVIALEEARRFNIPIRIVHSHSTFANKGKLQIINNMLHHIHQKNIINFATDFCACSEKAAEWLFGGMRLGDVNVKILKNGVDMNRYKYNPLKRNLLRKELGLDNKKVIGHIGAFLPVKNHKFLINIISKLHEQDSSIRAIFVGDGYLRSEIESQIEEKNLKNVIRLLGVRSDIEDLLQVMDIFVMPSLYEGLPVSLIEAQSSGVPILISDSITREVMINENVANCSLNAEYKQWADIIMKILNQQNWCLNQKKLIDNGFDIMDTIKQYRSIICRRVI